MRHVLCFVLFFTFACGEGDPKPGSPGAPGSDGSDGEAGSPGEPGPSGPGKDAIISSVSCELDWNYENSAEVKRGVFLAYSVMTFSTGDVLAGLSRIYYNNNFSQKQNVAALWPKSYENKEKAHVGDSVFSAHLDAGKAIFTLQATGEKREVACAASN